MHRTVCLFYRGFGHRVGYRIGAGEYDIADALARFNPWPVLMLPVFRPPGHVGTDMRLYCMVAGPDNSIGTYDPAFVAMHISHLDIGVHSYPPISNRHDASQSERPPGSLYQRLSETDRADSQRSSLTNAHVRLVYDREIVGTGQ